VSVCYVLGHNHCGILETIYVYATNFFPGTVTTTAEYIDT